MPPQPEGTQAYYRLVKKFEGLAEVPDPYDRKCTRIFRWKLFGSYLLAAPFVIVGLALCFTVIGIIFGVPIMVIGCLPLMETLSTRSAHKVIWENRDRPWNEDDAPPWTVN